MSITVLLTIAVAGGCGAAARFALDSAITASSKSRIPVGTLVINISGSFLLALATGLLVGKLISADVLAIAGTGFLGGYTTFSTASTQTVDLIRDRHFTDAAVYAAGMLLGSVVAAAAGFWLATAWV
ncbi:fluoride efflux transporter CrcB [Microbacterium sp. P01]|uniref:fluoride efflux transporter CrcB n=1 Tax=unclassified Microbacterium TaxID=2609290 RepID=UPI003672313E